MSIASVGDSRSLAGVSWLDGWRMGNGPLPAGGATVQPAHGAFEKLRETRCGAWQEVLPLVERFDIEPYSDFSAKILMSKL